MITFITSLAILILGYLFYGRFVERVFGPDDRVTPAIAKRDNVDFMVLPNWKVYMIQFLNIAGTGPIFGAIMGAMVTEGLVALIWATIGMWFFYADPTPGYDLIEGSNGFSTSAPAVVHLVSHDWLGAFGAVLAMLGVMAAPITSGDTAFRSSRLIVADWLKIDHPPVRKRLFICLPLFAISIAMLVWQIANPNGFNIIWQYMGFFNQTLAVFTLWALTAYLVQERKCFWITLITALFMTAVCSTYFFVSKQILGLPISIGYPLGGLCVLVAIAWFAVWYLKTITKAKQT